MTASEQLKLNLAKAERAYRHACVAVIASSTHYGLRDAKIAREKARLNLALVQKLVAEADNREDADEVAYLDA